MQGLYFVLLNIQGALALADVGGASGYKVFFYLVSKMRHSGHVFVTRKRIAKDTKLSERVVAKAIAGLLDAKAIYKEGRGHYVVSPSFARYGNKLDRGPLRVVSDPDVCLVSKSTGEIVG